MKSEKINILGIDISLEDLDLIVKRSIDMVKKGDRHYICVPNAYSTVVANSDDLFRKIINGAAFTVPDGMPLVWYSKTYPRKLNKRVSGFELFKEYSLRMDEEKMSCFFLGGKDSELMETLIEKFKKEYKGIRVAGFFVPPFLDEFKGEHRTSIMKVINECRPDVVWVGMSAPKQEKWIYDNISGLDIGMACGVGAVFDFYCGNIRRAPGWMQKAGLEWVYRIIADPRRLFKKYIVYNTKFIILLLSDIIKRPFRAGRIKSNEK